MSIIFSPDLKFCPDLFGDLKSRSYFVPIWGRKVKLQLLEQAVYCIAQEEIVKQIVLIYESLPKKVRIY